ncbi:type I secretion system permease/ATPase [Photobacterium sp. J15]|uniref:type I secretion system permease/ATPase n=1 Tax=Photobacterium sp. J15 TaxID=265901 RepID=UPI0007E48C35|nr:type I secretion system permease/ATPase [Photobacterium sp. J15]
MRMTVPFSPVLSDAQTNYALESLIYAAKSYGQSASPELMKHQLGVDDLCLSELHIRQAACQLNLKGKYRIGAGGDISYVPLPALVQIKGRWFTIETVEDGQWKVYDAQTDSTVTKPLPEASQLEILPFIFLVENSVIKADVKFGLKWFIPSVVKNKHQLRDVFLVAVVIQLIALVSPMLFSNLIDKVLVSRGISSLHVLALAMFGLAIAEPLYSYIRACAYGHLSSKVNAEISSKLYQHLTSLPLNYFKQRQTGQIIARVREMAQIRQFLTGSAIMLVLDLIFVVVFLAVMFHYATTLTWIVIGSLVIYFVFWLTVGPMIRSKVVKQYEADADATSFLTEALTGIETIKTTATENRSVQSWQKILASQITKSFSATKMGLLASQGISLVQKLTAAIILWFGVHAVLKGELSIGGLVAFNMLSGHVTQPILRLAQVWQDFQHTLIALRRIGDILDEPQEQSSDGLASVPELSGSIEFNHVRFRYSPDTPEVLSDLSFKANAGEFIGITGPSGSGKSTITRLLQRLHTPQHGQVLIDGMDLAIADPVTLRQNMSIVLQESVLFAGTVEENIRICKPSATNEEVWEAARLAGAYDFIEALPKGFATLVGEKGSMLSGGQRQRIALARALIVNPRILILDEATSALDYESEAAIMANLDNITKQRTVVSIAHRLNTIKNADRILVVDDGRVIETGVHHELVNQKGVYGKLWQQQTF